MTEAAKNLAQVETIPQEEKPRTDAQRMIAVIEQATVNPDVTPEKLRQMLDIQLVVMDRQAKIEFDEAMAQCQSDMAELRILKKAENKQTDSNYAKHEAICAAIKPVYTKHGFRLSFAEGKPDLDGEIRVHCTVTHRMGHSEAYWMDLPADSAGIKGTVNKTPIHAKGSTFSYGRRYLTLMIFDLATYDDNDGNRPPQSVELITEEQVNQLHSKATEHGILDDFKKWLTSAIKVKTIEDIPAAAFNVVSKKLDQSIKARSKSKEKKNAE